ncbi:MAG: hypothetical protein ACRC62_27945 [Microcoleus sp.]
MTIDNRSRAPDARTTIINYQSIASSRRSHYNYQLSIDRELPTLALQLSTIN